MQAANGRWPTGVSIITVTELQGTGPTSRLYNGYLVFTGVKRSERGVDHPPSSSVEVKEREGLYFYPLYGLSWNVMG